MKPLPIDPLIDDLVKRLRASPNLVLEAPPGAGKTTRVPPALLDAGLAGDKEILVLEPRRLAARLPARFVAEERGERVGESVGFQVRHESSAGPRTRLKYITEAILLRRLVAEPTLGGVGALVFDEFHERHLSSDLGLALALRLQATSRPDLELLVMSATLRADPIANFLGDCPVLRAEGRVFPVATEYATAPDARPIEAQVTGAVSRLCREGLDGDVLVFLPGAAEIRRSAERLADLAARNDLLVLPLHGDLAPEEQDRAVQPADRRKIILSTNVAETSVTIDGVVAVVDTGLARVASSGPWSGLATLKLQPISRASAAQRAGRAGRTRPGRCLRLYTRHDHDTRPADDKPEVCRAELSEAVLLLAGCGVSEPAELPWLTAPPPAALAAAKELLMGLGALGPDGALTPDGEFMLRFPVHPRQARIILEASRRGVGRQGCLVAACLGDRDNRPRAARQRASSGPSDVLELCELVEAGLAARSVTRTRDELARLLAKSGPQGAKAPKNDSDSEQALLVSILAGYPDRVAERRQAGGERKGASELLLASGGRARLADESVVRDAHFVVALTAEERREGKKALALVRLASRIEPEWLLELFPDRLADTTSTEWNDSSQRAETVRRITYGDLVLEESRSAEVDPAQAAPLVAQAARGRGAQRLTDSDAVATFLARAALVRVHFPELELPTLAPTDVELAFQEACAGRRSIADVDELALLAALKVRLGPEKARALDRLAPKQVVLASGRKLAVHYEAGKPPWVESYLQDFFGMSRGPSVGGRVPVTLHLLAPNRRAVQVTTDLSGFWQRHYPELRRALARRYPKHAWPEAPERARPVRRK